MFFQSCEKMRGSQGEEVDMNVQDRVEDYESHELPGKVTVDPSVLETIALLTARSVEGVVAIPQSTDTERFLGLARQAVEVQVEDKQVTVEVHLLAAPGISLLQLGRQVQRAVTRAIEKMIGMPVAAVNVYIEDVIYPEAEAVLAET